MKREAVLRALKAAGATNDRQAWTRLYVENRVSLTVANRLWREGVQWGEFVRYRDAKVNAFLGETVVVVDPRPNYARDRNKGAQGD